MIKNIKNIDAFGKNIILVFLGTSLANFFNLLYLLFIAHKLSPVDFAAFNSLLSILMLISTPLATLQIATAKYCAEFNAQKQTQNIQALLSCLLKITIILAILIFFGFYFTSFYIMDKLKIYSIASGYILAFLLSLSCITPIFFGGILGLELFKWLMSVSVITGALKLILAFIFIMLGFNIAGAFGALLVSGLIGLIISYLPLKDFIRLRVIEDRVNFKKIFLFLLPVAISAFCFIGLVSFDMVLVKYFFSSTDSGLYSLAQIVGKIILFLPGAIGIVMFPRTSGLNAKKLDTSSTLKRSLLYATVLCLVAVLGYNLLPSFTIKVLTGKVFPESIILGRLFSVSMSFFALLYILISYFLSIKDLRFIKYLVLFTLFQLFAIMLFHKSLIQVQLILCINSILLFLIHLILANKKGLSLIEAG